MLRICRNLLRAGLAFGLMAVCATGAYAQFNDDEFGFGKSPPAVKASPRVSLPQRKPAKPSQFAAEAANASENSATPSPEKQPGAGRPAKKSVAAARATFTHEAGRDAAVPVKEAAREVVATLAHETGPGGDNSNPGSLGPDFTSGHERRAVDDEEAKATAKPRGQGAANKRKDPKKKGDVATGRDTAKEDAKPTGAIAPRKTQAEQKQARRTIEGPARRAPKPRKAPAATKRKKTPQPGTRKTRDQQCASLTICRQAFAKCRFSKEREKLDENGWEVHKKYCGDIYQKCISSRFGEGELFFTRWFLPYDPCS